MLGAEGLDGSSGFSSGAGPGNTTPLLSVQSDIDRAGTGPVLRTLWSHREKRGNFVDEVRLVFLPTPSVLRDVDPPLSTTAAESRDGVRNRHRICQPPLDIYRLQVKFRPKYKGISIGPRLWVVHGPPTFDQPEHRLELCAQISDLDDHPFSPMPMLAAKPILEPPTRSAGSGRGPSDRPRNQHRCQTPSQDPALPVPCVICTPLFSAC